MPDLQPPSPTQSVGARGGVAEDVATSGADALAGLKKMSTTAGLGAGDYVAINPLAIAAVLLGLFSLLTPILNSDLLLAVPAGGLACAAVAWRQIRRSNGTQSGYALSVAGAALSLMVGGGILGFKGYTEWKFRPDTKRIAQMISKLGEDLALAGEATRAIPVPTTQPSTSPTAERPSAAAINAARYYHDAYQMFSDKFRARVSERRFVDVWSGLNRSASTGGVKAMEWNGRIEFATDTGSGSPIAAAMALLRLRSTGEMPRQWMSFTRAAGVWEIDDIPVFFPPDRPGQRPAAN